MAGARPQGELELDDVQLLRPGDERVVQVGTRREDHAVLVAEAALHQRTAVLVPSDEGLDPAGPLASLLR